MIRDAQLLWVGGGIDPLARRHHPAVSPAAHTWQRHFVNALNRRFSSLDIDVLAPLPAPYWPRGPLRPSAKAVDMWKGVDVYRLEYWNSPGLRAISHRKSIVRMATKRLASPKATTVLVTYNLNSSNVGAVKALRRRGHAFLWIPVVADLVGDDPERLRTALADAQGVVVLSRYARDFLSDSFVVEQIEGGIENPLGPELESTGVRPVLYAGSRNVDSGFNVLVEAAKVRRGRGPIWLVGAGPSPLPEPAMRDLGLIDFGLVSENELSRLCSMAAAFVNPRIGGLRSDFSFPSKLLLYLRHVRPIISTETASLPDDYRGQLNLVAPSSAGELAAALDAAGSGGLMAPTRSWLHAHRWDHMAERFEDLLGRAGLHDR